MKLPVPKTLVEANSPIILLNWALGIGVIEFPNGTRRRIISACWSLVNFLICLGFVRMANFSEVVQIQGSKISSNNYRVNAYLGVVFVGVSMCLAPVRSKLIVSNFHKIVNLNDEMKILGIPYDYDVVFKNQIIQLSLGSVAMTILMILDFNFVGSEFPSETSRLGFLFSFHYSLVFTFVVDWSFSDIVRYFGNRFRRLNELLIKSDKSERSRPGSTKKSDSQIPPYSWIMNDIYQNHPSSLRAAEKHSLLHLVRETRRIHHGLCRTAIELNRAFGFQLLFSVTLSLSLMISLIYGTFVLNTSSSSKNSIFNVWVGRIIDPMWIAFYAVKVLLIVQACEKTSSEIRIFSLKLIQNPLYFTARGFFNLDYALISGIIGSVTTYVIIMIQMRSIYEPEKVNATPNSTMFTAHLNDTN